LVKNFKAARINSFPSGFALWFSATAWWAQGSWTQPRVVLLKSRGSTSGRSRQHSAGITHASRSRDPTGRTGSVLFLFPPVPSPLRAVV